MRTAQTPCHVQEALTLAAAVATGPDDAALIGCAQRGDVEAFAALYDRHAPKVLTLARYLLGSAADADDLLHDVFLESWQSVRDYDPARASVLSWLLMRTRSRARDRLIRRTRERRVLERARPLTDRSDAPEHHGLSIHHALAALDTPVRTALELMYVAGMTAREISAHTQVPEGTVRSRLARGLALLGHALR